MGLFQKLEKYCLAAVKLKSPNLQGLPIIPKSMLNPAPHNRESYNQFVLWIHRLGLDKADCILDVGANHGDFSMAATRCFPQANVVLFEPLPALQAALQRRCEQSGGRWTLAPIALGRRRGETQIHFATAQDGIGSLLGFSPEYRAQNPGIGAVYTLQCTVETLDDLAMEKEWRRIDLLKIDVEGFEAEVTAGGRAALRMTQGLILEISLVRNWENALGHFREIINTVVDAGLCPVALIPSWFSREEPGRPLEFNLLARRFAPLNL